jgi:uracil-DNA glycosylase
MNDSPKLLGEPEARRGRLELLQEPHVAPLTRLVEAIRAETKRGREVPYFDPLDGGTHAPLLFLLEAPGPKAVASGFVSRNNPDESAKNFFLACAEAGLARQLTVVWNVVPWYLGDGKKIRTAKPQDLKAGALFLPRLIGLLPMLNAVVLVGGRAQATRTRLVQLLPARVVVLDCPHPSAQFVNRLPGNWSRLVAAIRRAAACVTQQGSLQQGPGAECSSAENPNRS